MVFFCFLFQACLAVEGSPIVTLYLLSPRLCVFIVFKSFTPSNSLLTVLGGSYVVVRCCLFLMSEFRCRFILCVFILYLFRFWLLSGHILGKNCSLG